MNKVYLDKDGKLFVNGHEIKGVMSVSSETDYLGTQIVLKLKVITNAILFHQEKDIHYLNVLRNKLSDKICKFYQTIFKSFFHINNSIICEKEVATYPLLNKTNGF